MIVLSLAAGLLLETGMIDPVPPQPLRKLFREAEIVAVARAGASVPVAGSETYSRVVLSLQKIIKGKPGLQEVTVTYEPGVVCPAPDRYPEGKTLLVFLKWREPPMTYVAPGLSHGVRELDDARLARYVRRLEELARIPAEKRDADPSPETIDWLVRCMEDPVTRLEGLHEFTAASGRDGFFTPPAIPVSRLSKDQLRRLTNAFVVPRSFALEDLPMLEILKTVADDRIATFLATELRWMRATGETLCAEWIIPDLGKRLGIKEADAILLEYRDARDGDARLSQIQKFLDLVEQR